MAEISVSAWTSVTGGPTDAWLPIDKAWIPGHPGLAGHITRSILNAGFDPAFSEQFQKLPVVPIVQNCAVKPMMPLRSYYEFGGALGVAIRCTHEIRSWIAVAGTVASALGRTLTYEPIFPWITGMGVSRFQLTS